jgi:hypothetical protein
MAPPSVPPPVAPAVVDAEGFRRGLQPSIFGLPSNVVAGIAVGAVFLVIILALLLSR